MCIFSTKKRIYKLSVYKYESHLAELYILLSSQSEPFITPLFTYFFSCLKNSNRLNGVHQSATHTHTMHFLAYLLEEFRPFQIPRRWPHLPLGLSLSASLRCVRRNVNVWVAFYFCCNLSYVDLELDV